MFGNHTLDRRESFLTSGLSSMCMGVISLVTVLLVIVSNGIVMVVVIFSRELHIPTLWNIAFMALCDCCYGLHYLVFAVPSGFMDKFAYSMDIAKTVASFNILLYGQNIFNVLLATVDRYLSVFKPLKYERLMTFKRFAIALFVTMIINICRLSIIIQPKTEIVYYNKVLTLHGVFTQSFSTIAVVTLPILTFLTIVSLLILLIRELSCSRRVVHAGFHNASDRQFTLTIILSAGIFCLAHAPTCLSIVYSFNAGKENVPVLLGQFALLFLLSNSLFNVIVYATTFKPFRNAFLRMFCKVKYREQRQKEIYDLIREEKEAISMSSGSTVSDI